MQRNIRSQAKHPITQPHRETKLITPQPWDTPKSTLRSNHRSARYKHRPLDSIEKKECFAPPPPAKGVDSKLKILLKFFIEL